MLIKQIIRKTGAVLSVFALAWWILSVASSCRDRKPEPVDSVSVVQSDSVPSDTLSTVLEEQPMPKAADELFDDFFFNFAGNRRLQRKRIVFPLKVYRDGKLVKEIQKANWKIDHFFMTQDYYTLILDNMQQLSLVKDTTIDHVTVEKIIFKNKMVKQYLFNRVNGQWQMTSVNYKPMYQNQNASFLKFYRRFSTDSAFQVRSMAPTVTFTAPDPDNDFSTITGSISPEQWPTFRPALIPGGVIYNIIYGQKYTESNQKIFVVRGIANGLEMEMTFKRKGDRWRLTKFNNS